MSNVLLVRPSECPPRLKLCAPNPPMENSGITLSKTRHRRKAPCVLCVRCMAQTPRHGYTIGDGMNSTQHQPNAFDDVAAQGWMVGFALFTGVSCVTLAGNVVVIAAIMRTPGLRTSLNYLIVGQAVRCGATKRRETPRNCHAPAPVSGHGCSVRLLVHRHPPRLDVHRADARRQLAFQLVRHLDIHVSWRDRWRACVGLSIRAHVSRVCAVASLSGARRCPLARWR